MIPRYIEATDAHRVLCEYYNYRTVDEKYRLSLALSHVQTADVVEVVRCKDCKYSHKITDANVITLLSCNYQNAHGMLVENHGYCKWGKRKETEDDHIFQS